MAEVERVRVALRLHPDLHERVKYWAAKEGLSVNEWLAEAVEEKIARANGDYDLPTLEQARLVQILDETKAVSTSVANLESVVVSMSETIIGLARGDNYLLDPNEDGELATS